MLFVLPSNFLALRASSSKCYFVLLVRAVFAVLLDETRSFLVLRKARRRSIALPEIINRNHAASRSLFSVVTLFLQPVSPQFWNRQMPDRSVCSPCFLRRSDECQFVPPVRAVSPPFLTTSSNKSHVKYRPTPRRCSIWPAPPCNLLGQIHGRHQINPSPPRARCIHGPSTVVVMLLP